MTGVTVVGVRGHLVAVEAHVGRGLASGARRSAYAQGRGSSAPAPTHLRTETRSVRSDDRRHLPQCEYRDEVLPAVLKILLTVKPGIAPGYNWVTCAGCEGSWQVPHFESVG